MKLIDSHCHLDFDPLSRELADVVERASKEGVEKLVNIGSSLRGSEKSVEIATLYPNIWATVGLHPHDAEAVMDLDDAIEKLHELSKSDQVVAIGEIGLDYFGSNESVSKEDKEKQKKLFASQLDLAAGLKLPVVLHVRDAETDFLEILRNSKLLNRNSSKAPGVVHCFTGNWEFAKNLLDLGFCIGFTGFVTFDQTKFDHIREAAKKVPLEKMLIETDTPFLAPEPFRGKTNEPSFVKYVAEKIAELKGVKVEEVAKNTSQNTEKLFDI